MFSSEALLREVNARVREHAMYDATVPALVAAVTAAINDRSASGAVRVQARRAFNAYIEARRAMEKEHAVIKA